jgi:hypothetical protein
MTEDPHYAEESESARLRSWVLGQMMRGAGYAALIVVGLGLSLYVLYGLSLLLPEESKQAPSPNTGAALEQPVTSAVV